MTAGSADAPSRTGSGGPGRRILVLACGERERGDDAAGLLAADLLEAWLSGPPERRPGPLPPPSLRSAAEGLRSRVDVRRVGQLEPDDLLAVGPDQAVVVIDAVRGIPPGTVVCRPLADLAAGGPAPRSSHTLPLRDVLGLVQTLRGSLPQGEFVGLGGASFGLGEPPAAAVLEALPAFAAAVLDRAMRLAGE